LEVSAVDWKWKERISHLDDFTRFIFMLVLAITLLALWLGPQFLSALLRQH
jgi:hypothetical protein